MQTAFDCAEIIISFKKKILEFFLFFSYTNVQRRILTDKKKQELLKNESDYGNYVKYYIKLCNYGIGIGIGTGIGTFWGIGNGIGFRTF